MKRRNLIALVLPVARIAVVVAILVANLTVPAKADLRCKICGACWDDGFQTYVGCCTDPLPGLPGVDDCWTELGTFVCHPDGDQCGI